MRRLIYLPCFITFLLATVFSNDIDVPLPENVRSKGERISTKVNDAMKNVNKASGSTVITPLEDQKGFMRLFFTATPSASVTPSPSISPTPSVSVTPSTSPSTSPSASPSASGTVTVTPSPTKSPSPTPQNSSPPQISEVIGFKESTYVEGISSSDEVMVSMSDNGPEYKVVYDVNLSKNGIVSLDGISDWITEIKCSKEGRISIKFREELYFEENIQEMFPINSVLVFSTDLFGKCEASIDATLPGENEEDKEVRLLSNSVDTFVDNYFIVESATGTDNEIIVEIKDATYYAAYESGSLSIDISNEVLSTSRTIDDQIIEEGTTSSLHHLVRQASIKIDGNVISLGPLAIKAKGALVDETKIISFKSTWTTTETNTELVYQTGNSLSLSLETEIGFQVGLTKEVKMLISKAIRGFKIDFLKNIDLGRVKLPEFKVGIFGELPLIARGEFSAEKKIGDILSYNYQSQKTEVTMFMSGPYTDLDFGRDVKLISSATSDYKFNPTFNADSNTELKLKGFIGIRPQVALYIPLFSARLSVDIGSELEGKDKLGESAFPSLTTGSTIGVCETCHHHEIDLTGKITNLGLFASLGAKLSLNVYGIDWSIPLKKSLVSLTLPGNPSPQVKIGTGCFTKQYGENNLLCGPRCCDLSKPEENSCIFSSGEEVCSQCPEQKPFYNPVTQACEIDCQASEFPYYNPNTEKCEKCPDETPTYNPNLRLCEAKCPGGTSAGGDAPYHGSFELGRKQGNFVFRREHYRIKDRMVITYEGRVLHDTGCASGYESKEISYSGAATNVVVRVIPNCKGTTGTAWNFRVFCPNS